MTKLELQAFSSQILKSELNRSAMGGTVKFEEALAARLAVMNVSQASLDAFLRDHPPLLSPGTQPLKLVPAMQC